MNQLEFRAWNGHSMEYGGFALHATKGKIVGISSLSEVKQDSPVMQSTGLKDKNGKEIYEGDVVRRFRYDTTEKKYQKIEIVKSLQEFFEEKGYCEMELAESYDQKSMEVLGNIYQNPELGESREVV